MFLLNSGKGYASFEYEAQKYTYIDKTLLIDEVYRYARTINKYICITRPRRFGKTVAANMIAAFFDESTAEKSRLLFEELNIGHLKEKQEKAWKEESDISLCWPQQGKHKVIRINMINLFSNRIRTCQDFMDNLCQKLEEDLLKAYPSISFAGKNMFDMLEMTGDSYIFVIDEWDAVFEEDFMTDECRKKYILFLKSLLKDREYVHFAYMTGILPIAKYTSGSPLNMFHEFNSLNDPNFYLHFGLTEKEISALMTKIGYEKPTLEEMSTWYDGYVRNDGVHVYNPASVSKALSAGVCDIYWTGAGPKNEVRDIIQKNVQGVREDIIRMAGGESLKIKLSGFSAEKSRISTRDEILSAMVVYGFLSYSDRELRIPNYELMMKFQEALASEQMGLRQTLDDSSALLEATLARDHKKIALFLEELHDEKIPFFQYNDENSLACVVTVGYLAALDKYRIMREDKAGKGYVDFLFEPITLGNIPIILELKYNHSARNALKCIHERGYAQRFKNHKRILLVGINYSKRTKKHTCLTEIIEN